MVLLCIFLMTNDVGHLFTYYLAIIYNILNDGLFDATSDTLTVIIVLSCSMFVLVRVTLATITNSGFNISVA